MNSPLSLSDHPRTPDGTSAACSRLIADIRLLIKALREAEFKAGFVQWDVELSERKNKLAADLDALLQSKLDALENSLLGKDLAPAVRPPSA